MFMLLVGYAPTKLVQLSCVETIQYFLWERGMKPHAQLVKFIFFLYHHVIDRRPTKNYAEAEKKVGTVFARVSVLKIKVLKMIYLLKNPGRSHWVWTIKDYFKDQNLTLFEEVFNDFGWSHDDMMYTYAHLWFPPPCFMK